MHIGDAVRPMKVTDTSVGKHRDSQLSLRTVRRPAPVFICPGEELRDVRIDATNPALCFAVPIEESALVTVEFQEFNTASRCALFLSPSDPYPTTETAVWRLTSPDTKKRFTVHPADENYALGNLYLCVRYLEASGSAFFRLKVSLQRNFKAVWYCLAPRDDLKCTEEETNGSVGEHTATSSGWLAKDEMRMPSETVGSSCIASSSQAVLKHTTDTRLLGGDDGQVGPSHAISPTSSSLKDAAELLDSGLCGTSTAPDTVGSTCSSLYIGSWMGALHHGRGVAIYGRFFPSEFLWTSRDLLLVRALNERPHMYWSAKSLPSVSTDPGEGLESAVHRVSNALDLYTAHGWNVISLPTGEVEAYDGEWVLGKKQGRGVYQWRDMAYVGEWAAGLQEGYGVLEKKDGSWYKGNWHHGLRHGYGEALLVPSMTTYRGHWVDGFRQGEGHLEYPDGAVLTGRWRRDVLHPEVTVRYPDGSVYEGRWELDCRCGPGKLTDPSGGVHHHVWKNDRRYGEGRVDFPNGVQLSGLWEDDTLIERSYAFPNGDVYVGQWDAVACGREGFGRCITKGGDIYEGHWHLNEREGEGRMQYASGAEYVGSWSGNKRNGRGVLKDADGVYEGEFRDDERCGEGTQTNPDGSHYKGGWRNDHRAGPGEYYNAAEDVTYIGIFLHDRLQAQGKSVHMKSSDTYEGSWLDGKQQGRGTHTLPNGDIIRGLWHRGTHQGGEVEYVYAAGGTYQGEWENGQRHGSGTQLNVDGTVYEGRWVGDRPNGRGRLTKASGESVMCEWQDGRMVDCVGTVHFPDGSVYTGQLNKGKPHGVGELEYPDATVFSGQFIHGTYIL